MQLSVNCRPSKRLLLVQTAWQLWAGSQSTTESDGVCLRITHRRVNFAAGKERHSGFDVWSFFSSPQLIFSTLALSYVVSLSRCLIKIISQGQILCEIFLSVSLFSFSLCMCAIICVFYFPFNQSSGVVRGWGG